MKKRYLVAVFLFVLSVNRLTARQADTALAKITYHFSHIDDSTQREKPRQEDMVLYLGKHGSLYRRIMDEESKPLLYQSKGGSPDTFDILEESAAQIHLAGKSHTVERIIDNMYLITEDLPEISWQVSDEVKEIDGYTVQKATAHFRGRDYTAWFAPDIPFRYGPWKLQGLPGLILEARDSKDEVIFTYGGFESLPEPHTRIAVPKNFRIKKVTQKEYNKIYKGFLADPITFMQASLGVDRSRIVNGNPQSREKEYNNPIERDGN